MINLKVMDAICENKSANSQLSNLNYHLQLRKNGFAKSKYSKICKIPQIRSKNMLYMVSCMLSTTRLTEDASKIHTVCTGNS